MQHCRVENETSTRWYMYIGWNIYAKLIACSLHGILRNPTQIFKQDMIGNDTSQSALFNLQ